MKTQLDASEVKKLDDIGQELCRLNALGAYASIRLSGKTGWTFHDILSTASHLMAYKFALDDFPPRNKRELFALLNSAILVLRPDYVDHSAQPDAGGDT